MCRLSRCVVHRLLSHSLMMCIDRQDPQHMSSKLKYMSLFRHTRSILSCICVVVALLRKDEMKKKKKEKKYKTYVMPYSSANLKAKGLLDPEALIETV